MQVISLFSGIGGFELAAEWAGWQNIVSCEINQFGRKVLDYYWPNAYHHDDIHTLTYEKIDQELTKRKGQNWRTDHIVLTGGFPCQPYSAAGKRLGKDDERHLWPEMLRVIREVQPKWIVGENVLGLVNWSEGLVFDEVHADLEAEGYEVQAYVLPACSVNATHRRDRVWFVAYRKSAGAGRVRNEGCTQRAQSGNELFGECGGLPSSKEPTPNAKHNGHASTKGGRGNGEDSQRGEERQDHAQQLEGVCEPRQLGSIQQDAANTNNGSRPQDAVRTGWKELKVFPWERFPTVEPTIRSGNDGLPNKLDGITFSKWRNESIKAYGNAVVPQVVYQIFKAINEYERTAQIRP